LINADIPTALQFKVQILTAARPRKTVWYFFQPILPRRYIRAIPFQSGPVSPSL